MRIRSARALPAAVAVAATVTGSLSWAPTASAQSTDPTPSASTASTPRNAAEPETGGVAILKKDPDGDRLAGAAFALFDSAGKEAANGKTDAQGKLAFKDLAPGVYRLKEVSSGSNLHDTVDDQDVIVTPGTDTPLTIVDPFKDASVLLKAKDDKTGKLLAGSTVNIGSGDKTLLTLTTGSDGTATGKLPVNSRTGTDYWVKQVKAPAGYDLYKSSKDFKAKPGDPVTVTTTNAKTATTSPPTEKPTDKPTAKPSDKPSLGKPGKDEDTPAPSDSATPSSDETVSSTAAPAPEGSLAHTGADATPWLLGGAGFLIVAGGGALVVARRRRTDDSTDEN
ncbi:LPXTG-motif cell wall anchor domain-containing protein [Streptomyces sp. DI166]|uniref:SpaA isopeptide-forming pilin-related protein n=1 Tax=Streptomyces sp. DI166 TaxID=1839783 RepID=UPI0007F32F27|nr:SpaA isopeptide-forming pilin-related protein [Streptomyces sp. DI166]SBT93353.1 LPXTG-motif cell wall anchor domain-containing protein [Streptomyces sp. DI166]